MLEGVTGKVEKYLPASNQLFKDDGTYNSNEAH